MSSEPPAPVSKLDDIPDLLRAAVELDVRLREAPPRGPRAAQQGEVPTR